MDGATVGQVTAVRVEDYAAHVKMKIIEDQPLRAGGRAEIRLTSQMGTAFVELIDGKGENLPEGSVIGLASTTKSPDRSEEHTSELQSLMRIQDAVVCLK